MVDPDTKNTRGPIFDLINNFGYRPEADATHIQAITIHLERASAPQAIVGNEAKQLPAPQAVMVEGVSTVVKDNVDV